MAISVNDNLEHIPIRLPFRLKETVKFDVDDGFFVGEILNIDKDLIHILGDDGNRYMVPAERVKYCEGEMHSRKYTKEEIAAIKRCKNDACAVCRDPNVDAAHIRSYGAGGDTNDEGLVALCRKHHIQQHQYGWGKMVKEFKGLKEHLEMKGWIWHDGKLRRK